LWFLSKTFGKLPDDEFWDDLNPVLRAFMYNNWVQDQNDEVEVLKNHGYLIGGFINPDMYRKIHNNKEIKSAETDEEFERKTEEFFNNLRKDENQPRIKKRKRKILNG
jgi:hypothetical protein